MKDKQGGVDNFSEVSAERRRVRDVEIRKRYATHKYSMAQLAREIGVSTTTVFFAVHGR